MLQSMILISMGFIWGMLASTDKKESGLIGVVAAILGFLFVYMTVALVLAKGIRASW